jgi:acyl dehydratase
VFAIQTQREWQRFCAQVMESPSLESDPRFATNGDRLANRADLERMIEAIQHDVARRSYRTSRGRRHSDGAVNDVPSVVAHPQLAARTMGKVQVGGAPAPPAAASQPAERSAADAGGPGVRRAHGRGPERAGVTRTEVPNDRRWLAGGRCSRTHGGSRDAPSARRTVTATDNIWSSLMTVNTNPVHFDAHYAAQTEFGRPLMNSCFTIALVTGLSVADVSRNAFNLGWDEVRMPAPLFEGDTVYAQSKVLSTRESKSRPTMGIVEIETIGFKQDGTVVMTFRRTILVYKRGHVPTRPEPRPNVATEELPRVRAN